MKLADISNGPDWVIWVAFVIILTLSVLWLSGHGSGLISGYNTASKAEKARYDEKRLCRTMGAGMAVIAVCILISGLFQYILPADSVYVFIGVIIADIITTLMIASISCRK